MRAWLSRQRLHLGDDVVLELLVAALLRGRERIVAQLVLDVLVLQAAQPLVGIGDVVEGLDHLGLELGLDRGERKRILHVVVVEIAFIRRRLAALGFLAVGTLGRRLERSGARRRGRGRRGLRQAAGSRCRADRLRDRLAVGPDRGRHGLGVGAGIGRFEVDDVPQEHLSLVELVAPDDDGLERERALAQARDHRLAAGLDALGDGDLALARQELHRAHFTQIHAHGVVGALGRLLGLGLGRDLLLDLDQLAALAFRLLVRLLALPFLVPGRLLGLDHVCEDVLDLLGIDLLRGQDRIDLVRGDVVGGADELLDGRIRQVERRAVGRGLGTLLLRRLFLLRRRIGCYESLHSRR